MSRSTTSFSFISSGIGWAAVIKLSLRNPVPHRRTPAVTPPGTNAAGAPLMPGSRLPVTDEYPCTFCVTQRDIDYPIRVRHGTARRGAPHRVRARPRDSAYPTRVRHGTARRGAARRVRDGTRARHGLVLARPGPHTLRSEQRGGGAMANTAPWVVVGLDNGGTSNNATVLDS